MLKPLHRRVDRDAFQICFRGERYGYFEKNSK